ncbi:hypothetical protein Tco_1249178 [Tanacetum coccineum]
MAQPQCPADVHQDELCLPNKRYALMDANKKVDLENPLCPDESRILANILQNHSLGLSIAASSSVPWIYMWQTIFHLPQATDNNHDGFVPALSFFDMVPFYINHLGFTLELRAVSNFKTTGKNKNVVGMRIPDWMITEEMKLTENYRLYAEVFGVDVPMTQSQPTESTQGTHRITSTPRTPTPVVAEGESKAEDIVLQDEARENVEKVKEHLMAEENEKLVEGSENVAENVAEYVDENVEVSSSPPRNDDIQNVLGTRLEPRSGKESPEVEITVVVPRVNVNDEEEETAVDDYDLKRRVKRKEIEESRNTPSPTAIRSLRIHSTLIYSKILRNSRN